MNRITKPDSALAVQQKTDHGEKVVNAIILELCGRYEMKAQCHLYTTA